MSKMNPSQKRISSKIRKFCKEHAYQTQLGFKLFPTDLCDEYGRRIALCEYGVVTVYVGATIDNWREFPTRTLEKFLKSAQRVLAKAKKTKTNDPATVI